MRMKSFIFFLTAALLLCCYGAAAELAPLPMDSIAPGPAPQDEGYLSDMEYEDESISVKLYKGRYADTDYVYAHIKISHPSQLRTAPAALVDSTRATFKSTATARGRYVAKAANAVIAINGDYFTKTDKCQVVLRQSQQVRNIADGLMDLLIIDHNGDFSYINKCTKDTYAAYYAEHKDEMYNVFCFGPVLVENGVRVIADDYQNGYVGAQNAAQRSAIAQLGPLEYMLITANGPQTDGNKGMTIPEFAAVCEEAGRQLNEKGCALAFNLDGGNSATLVFKAKNHQTGNMNYVKVNCPEIERFLSDIIYFATLVNQ